MIPVSGMTSTPQTASPFKSAPGASLSLSDAIALPDVSSASRDGFLLAARMLALICRLWQFAWVTLTSLLTWLQFNVILNETDVLQEHLQEWKRPDLGHNRPAPLVVEIYIDTGQLANNQALVLVDEGKRWDVADALGFSSSSKRASRYCEVVLERWTIELGDSSDCLPDVLNDTLPNVYKKGVVLFRSLYTLLRFLPAWKLHRKLGRASGNGQPLRLKWRIRPGQRSTRGAKASSAMASPDPLYAPLCLAEQQNPDSIVQSYGIRETGRLLCPVGPLSVQALVRNSASFALADTDSLLSSRFDDSLATVSTGRSLPSSSRPGKPAYRYSTTMADRPAARSSTGDRPRGLLGAYGSLGTFHATDKRGSPVSELKLRALQADDDDDGQMDRMSSQQGRRGSLNLIENPPFKAGSLTSSPRPSPSSGTSAGRHESSFMRPAPTSAGPGHSRNSSLNTLPQLPQRRSPATMPSSDPAGVSPTSASPKPSARFSSSFANRKNRFTAHSSKGGESPLSSGRASTSSKEKSNSLLPDGGAGSSGGSGGVGGLQPHPTARPEDDDDDDITDFIKTLERTTDLSSASAPATAAAASSAAPTPHMVNLARFTCLRDTGAQLADEMSASVTPPSRRLSNVPGLSVSPPVSPSSRVAMTRDPAGGLASMTTTATAAQHVPFVRSRLSVHSVAEEVGDETGLRSRPQQTPRDDGDDGGGGTEHEDALGPGPGLQQDDDDDAGMPFIFQLQNDL